MRFNDRSMALAGIPDLPIDAFRKEGGKIKLHGGGGPSTTKSETSNIPEYARPYVERMMGSTEKQIYTYGNKGNITGFQQYKPFEGETVAGFSPTQAQAMRGISGYQLPGQTDAATQMTGYAGMGSMGAGQQYEQQATNPYATQAYMSPYMENALAPQMREAARQSAIQGQQNQAQAVQQGAFGGARTAMVEAERQRNLGQLQGDIYGKGMQSAFEQARQAQQFGAELGLKGYGQGLQAAGQLGALGQQQYGQEMGLLGQQMAIGDKQQAYEQQRLNQKIQDYATQQQYPFIQLGTLSNMLRGLPMQASTTQMYQAQPPALQQAIGLAGAGANLYQSGIFGGGKQSKEGGAIKEMASGGIATGADPYKLPSMMKKLSDQQLGEKMGGETDPETMGIAQAEKQRRDQVRAGAPKMMAGGGVVAFKEAGAVKDVAPKVAPVSATPYRDKYNEALTEFAPPPEVDKTRANIKELEDRVAAGVTGELDRQQAAFAKLGIDPAKMFDEEHARRQEEIKMSREDASRAEYLRRAQMFAKFGSTPGPILKAALISINDTVPDLLEDQAKASAIQREANKAINDLNRAEYLEKKGRVDDAVKSHNAAAEKAATLTSSLGEMLYKGKIEKLKSITDVTEREMASASAEKQANISAAATRYSADKREKGETERDKLRTAADERKEKERISRDTTAYLKAMAQYDKENKEQTEQLDRNLRLMEDKNGKAYKDQAAELAKKRLERIEYEAKVREAYRDARINTDATPAPATGNEVKFSNPKTAEYYNQYK